jgi:hypothetical protein
MVRPTILNGSNKSQMNGNNISITSANGQHNTRRINQSTIAANVLIVKIFSVMANS